MDRLTALNVFRHVAELQSFAEAGRRLGLSPAAISKNIAELERHLSCRLIHRTTRRMALTEEGRLYYRQVAQVLDDLDEADRSLFPMQATPSGVLRVSAPTTVTLKLLSPAIPRFLAQYPQLTLELDLDDRRVDLVKEGYDLAIRGSDRLEDSSLIARKLTSLEHVLCGSPAYFQGAGIPTRPADLARHNCIQFSLSSHSDFWEFSRGSERIGVSIDGRYKVGSSLAVRDALLAGFGLSVIPRVYVEDDLLSGAVVPVLTEWSLPLTEVYAVYGSRVHLALKVRVFLDFVSRALGGQ
ncbi:transcriptional regulator [Sinorhizobium sp. A49]|uniref:LysR family transcriptional regulator n=1 Tax=Sinorhizobium sp. A49 TaxID=1945861 RepID=UPI000984C4E9|nr:LysR family transcriptional regulator [Sinorhizobium sp. A49]OOG64209.1 transcriptional regulator [Sinorhizobium sp. A49]